uniref:Uncharacterized protein n=1 Tax=Plectus sambesii TaxID=2011161 RepID=A0A914XFC1_9BILA
MAATITRKLLLVALIIALLAVVDARSRNSDESGDNSESREKDSQMARAKRFIHETAEMLHLTNRYKRHARAVARNFQLIDGN